MCRNNTRMTSDVVEKTVSSDELLKNGFVYSGDKGPKFGVRYVQILAISIGSLLCVATKSVVFSMAIVAMTVENSSSNPDIPTYDWDNTGTLLSAVLWSGIAVNVLSAYLGKKYGPKWLLIGSNLINGVFFVLIPLLSEVWGSHGVMFCRIVQGVAIGFFEPLTSDVYGRWVPPGERSKVSYAGGAVIALLAMASSVISGTIAASPLGWPWMFYFFGIFAGIWSIWYTFVGAQNPRDHPQITEEEKQYIEVTLAATSSDTNKNTPWRKILTNIHVWAVIIGGVGTNWVATMMATQTSVYLAKVLEFDIQANGIIMALPTLVSVSVGAVLAFLSDWIPKRGLLKVVNSRRLFHGVGSTGMVVSLIGLTFIPVELKYWAPAVLCLSNVFIMGTNVGGYPISLMDLSPKYMGVIYGLMSTLSQAVGLFAPLTVQWVCTDLANRSQWRIVYIITAVVVLSTALFFVIFASSTRQEWDDETEYKASMEVKIRKCSILSASLTNSLKTDVL